MNSITFTILASTAVLAKAYPYAYPHPDSYPDSHPDPHDGYYAYIGYDWPINSRYYYPQKGYYYHYLPPSVEYPNPEGTSLEWSDEPQSRSAKLTKTDQITFPEEKLGDVVDIADEDGSFNSFVNLVYDLGFAETLKGVESVTVFAPTDEAFAKAFPDGTFENLTSKQAKDIVSRHIIVGATVKADDIENGTVGTFAGEYIEFYKNGREEVQLIYDNQIVANIVAADLEASNGVVHVIDSVIL